MPQTQACKPKSRLREELESRIADKMSMRRKTFKPEQREKELQVNLRELSCEPISNVEEVNLVKSDGTVIQFISPKMEVNTESNTFIVSGDFAINKIDELLSVIIPQTEDLTPNTDRVINIGDDQKDTDPMHPLDPNVPVNSPGFMVGDRVQLQIGKTGVVRYAILESVLLFILYHVCNIPISNRSATSENLILPKKSSSVSNWTSIVPMREMAVFTDSTHSSCSKQHREEDSLSALDLCPIWWNRPKSLSVLMLD